MEISKMSFSKGRCATTFCLIHLFLKFLLYFKLNQQQDIKY
jgi:hypothetical protein